MSWSTRVSSVFASRFALVILASENLSRLPVRLLRLRLIPIIDFSSSEWVYRFRLVNRSVDGIGDRQRNVLFADIVAIQGRSELSLYIIIHAVVNRDSFSEGQCVTSPQPQSGAGGDSLTAGPSPTLPRARARGVS